MVKSILKINEMEIKILLDKLIKSGKYKIWSGFDYFKGKYMFDVLKKNNEDWPFKIVHTTQWYNSPREAGQAVLMWIKQNRDKDPTQSVFSKFRNLINRKEGK